MSASIKRTDKRNGPNRACPLGGIATYNQRQDGYTSSTGAGEAVHDGVADCQATRKASTGQDGPARLGKERQKADAGERVAWDR